MTRNDVLQLNTSFEIWVEAQKNPALFDDEEVMEWFDRLCEREYKEFERQVEDEYGTYNPDMHYDFGRKKS